jgi:hypothetical protein
VCFEPEKSDILVYASLNYSVNFAFRVSVRKLLPLLNLRLYDQYAVLSMFVGLPKSKITLILDRGRTPSSSKNRRRFPALLERTCAHGAQTPVRGL